ncbi:protein kinase family protein, partial [Candidatus Margulisiibacteriota bacterium]
MSFNKITTTTFQKQIKKEVDKKKEEEIKIKEKKKPKNKLSEKHKKNIKQIIKQIEKAKEQSIRKTETYLNVLKEKQKEKKFFFKYFKEFSNLLLGKKKKPKVQIPKNTVIARNILGIGKGESIPFKEKLETIIIPKILKTDQGVEIYLGEIDLTSQDKYEKTTKGEKFQQWKIAQGGNGVVIYGRNAKTSEPYAVKLSFFTKKTRNDTLKATVKEEKFLKMFGGKGVIKSFGTGEIKGKNDKIGAFYIVTELCKYGDFNSLMNWVFKNKKVGNKLKALKYRPFDLQKYYFRKICQSFLGIHKKIIHGDIKPSNILLNNNGNPVMTDFGFADYLEIYQKNKYGLGGTIMFLSPEMAARIIYALFNFPS